MTKFSPIAVVGVSALFPGSPDAKSFWRNILDRRDLVTEVPASHWLIDDYFDPDPSAPDKTYVRRGAFLDTVEFDPVEFGIPPNVVPATDTSQLLALIVAQKVLEDATQGDFTRIDRDRVSVILGVTSGQELLSTLASRLQKPVWLKALRESGIPEDEAQKICERIASNYQPWQESSFPGLLGNVVAGRIANRFDLRGTNCITDAACASSLSALSMAVNELILGQSDLVITGGVDAMNDVVMFVCFSKTPALSISGDCRPFSDSADGTMLGEGLGMLALKRLTDAERDGDQIYAVIRGVGSSSDGRSKSIYAPVSEGQAKALQRAYAAAGYGPETVELMEAHGTGTKAGDMAEFNGLRLTFEQSGRSDRQWCALGSIKSQIGHTKAAAGAAGLFKAIMALHHKILPPTIKVEKPDPKLEIENSPFYINTIARPWIRSAKQTPRRASVSSFGFGGSNFHVTLDEYRGSGKTAARFRTSPVELTLFASSSSDDLLAQCRRAAAMSAEEFRFRAYQSQQNFQPLKFRLAVVAEGADDLRSKLTHAAGSTEKNPLESFSSPSGIYYTVDECPGKIAFLFPGQGSQYVSMGGDLAMAFDEARSVWDAAAEFGIPLHDIVFPRPAFTDRDRQQQADQLTLTSNAQPAIGAVSLALLSLLARTGLTADYFGGHSFGEITALHAAGAFDSASLLRIARRRGELMAEAASNPGGMLAVSLPENEVRELTREWNLDVVLANHNHPNQVVLSGSLAAIADTEKRFSANGVAIKRLPVAAAFHSPLVERARAPFATFLQQIHFSSPSPNVYNGTDATIYSSSAAQTRERLASQIVEPVCFVEEIEAMYAAGVRTFVEVGPGSILSDLVGRILCPRAHLSIPLDRKGKNGQTSLWEGLGRLIVAGASLRPLALWDQAPPDPSRLRKPTFSLPVNGANYAKPYPPKGGPAGLPKPNPPRPISDTSEIGAANGSIPSKITSDSPVDPIMPDHPIKTENSYSTYEATLRHVLAAHDACQRSIAENYSTFIRSLPSSGTRSSMPLAPDPIGAEATAVPPPISRNVAISAALGSEQLAIEPSQAANCSAAFEVSGRGEILPETNGHDRNGYAYIESISRKVPTEGNGASTPIFSVSSIEPEPESSQQRADLQKVLLEVVSEKTGYPVEMLEPKMELEADLGIDSIKRVEILSGLRSRAPELPEIDVSELGGLTTIEQILDVLQRSQQKASPPSAPAVIESTFEVAAVATASLKPSAVSATSSARNTALLSLLLEVISEKTGYPIEMLQPEMELEADLGIDSIKRVEILSALRLRALDLPELDVTELAAIRSINALVDYLQTIIPTSKAEEIGPISDIGHIRPIDTNGIDETLQSPVTPNYVIHDSVPHFAEMNNLPRHRLQRHVLREVTVSRDPESFSEFGDRVIVTNDDSGIAEALLDRLKARGVKASLASELPADTTAVIFLGGLRSLRNEADARAIIREAFMTAKRVAAHFEKEGGYFLIVQDTGGDFGLSGSGESRAWLAGLAALARTAALEWPKASVRALDVERGVRTPDELAYLIEQELLLEKGPSHIGLHADGRRTTILKEELTTTNPRGSSPTVDSQSVIVATGGARGVTAQCLIELARTSEPRIALIGRTRLLNEPLELAAITGESDLRRAILDVAKTAGLETTPIALAAEFNRIRASREIKTTLNALRNAGSEALYLSTDVRELGELVAVLEQVRKKWGPITSVIHAAGAIADKLISQKTDTQFDLVFDTKTEGLRALLEATRQDPLTLLCLFSSVAAREGNMGQCDYAMANEVLNAVAAVEARKRGKQCLVRSICWGPWEGGMVTPSLKAHFAERGVPLIPLEVGAQAFVDEIQKGSSPDVEVIITARSSDLKPEPTIKVVETLEIGQNASGDQSTMLVISVSHATHPYLIGHAIGSKPVVPVALALEWLARGARTLLPQLTPLVYRNIQVLRGIQLNRFAENGDQFTVKCRFSQSNPNLVVADLVGKNDVLHYRAVIEMGSEQTASARIPKSNEAIEIGPWRKEQIYDGYVLFHGPDFQTIRSVIGISANGTVGTIVGTEHLGWPQEDWIIDVALLDGGLQLAGLWAEEVLGGATLPMAVVSYRQYYEIPPQEIIRCTVRRRTVHRSRATSDIEFADSKGLVVAALEGVESILRPDEKPAPSDRLVQPVVAA